MRLISKLLSMHTSWQEFYETREELLDLPSRLLEQMERVSKESGIHAAFDEMEGSEVQRNIDETIAKMEIARTRYASCRDELTGVVRSIRAISEENLDDTLLVDAQKLSQRFDKDEEEFETGNEIVRPPFHDFILDTNLDQDRIISAIKPFMTIQLGDAVGLAVHLV